MIKLYDHPLSGNCYKVRLALSHLGVEFESIEVDIFSGEHKAPGFLNLNPCGKIPVIVDGGVTLWESNAILLYLGKNFSPNSIFSEEPGKFGAIAQWLLFGKTMIDPSFAPARYMMRFVAEGQRDMKRAEELRASATPVLEILDSHLAVREFLTDGYSIADIGCFPYINTAAEGGIALAPYKNVMRWCESIGSQKGFITMYE